MVVTFPEKGKVKQFKCYTHNLPLSFLRVGDFITYHGELMRVATIQRNCEPMARCQRIFTMVTLVNRNGEYTPVREFTGKLTVLRGKAV